MTRVSRRSLPVSELLQAAHLYLHNRKAAKEAENAKKDPYKVIVEHVKAHGEEDDTGSLVWYLDDPLRIGGKRVTGFQWKTVTGPQYIDEEKAQKLAREKDVVDRVTHTETVWDYDELYVLYQQGVISEAELDALLVTPEPTFRLMVLED